MEGRVGSLGGEGTDTTSVPQAQSYPRLAQEAFAPAERWEGINADGPVGCKRRTRRSKLRPGQSLG